MQLHPGDSVPAFRVEDAFGRVVALPAESSRFLLLSFFRNAGCAICNLRLAQLVERFPLYHQAGLDIVAVFESSPARVREQFRGRNVPFPVVADPDASLYDLFAVELSAEKVERTIARPETESVTSAAAAAGFPLMHEEGSNFQRIPADFLVGPDSTVRIAHYGEYVYDHLPFDVIEETVGLVAAV